VGRPRSLPFVLVGGFALLLVGGIVLSLSSAPPLARQQLQDAAKATMSAPSFAIVVTDSVTSLQPTSPASPSQALAPVRIRVLYQAPDAVEESEAEPGGATASVILIGSRSFRESNSQWTELPLDKGQGARAVSSTMIPLRAASNATEVTGQGGSYRFVPNQVQHFVGTVFGIDASEVSAPSLRAVVRGGYLTAETITAVFDHQRLALGLAFSAIGSAPPVSPPPVSPSSGPQSGAPATP